MFCDVEDDTLRPNPALIDVWIYESVNSDTFPFFVMMYYPASEVTKFIGDDHFLGRKYFQTADNAIEYMLNHYLDDSHTIGSFYVQKDCDFLCAHKNIQDPRESFRHGYGKGLTY